ncbi:hypothetical protein CDD80_7050 [Ophiocordyceps camponoti-rufipedis]|uniref:Vps72/YL1 N-terminal domain-containing protein n=1 Tax=Ophiocordyceps camponoti-rufipedis TaxID=2004952 RepID=A0A2C5YPV3_9HYPO|nr:hypothetical protein CDD80_7050 [Ophiocordyceps camponoti-rufipedis]
MAATDTESKAADGPISQQASDSDSDSSDETPATEWLATTRQRRSTAGNRIKSMLAAEEPDSDLELLFAEADDDEGFSVAAGDEAASDVHMDSSSSDSDDDGGDDDDQGEKELERQSQARRAAQRKKSAREAIPVKFRKRVRIDDASTTERRPKKKAKVERGSWLPSPADAPTRASSRQTTRLSKEQLHQQMVEREARRLRQLALAQKKAAKLAASKKAPMTQAERLAEAAVVEKANGRSLRL